MSHIPARRKRRRIRSGLYSAQRALSVGLLGQERAELERHLGGEPSVTQRLAVDGILELHLLIGSGVAALAEWGPINRRARNYRRLAVDVARLVMLRHKALESLGWTAKTREMGFLDGILAEQAASENANGNGSSSSPATPTVEPPGGTS